MAQHGRRPTSASNGTIEFIPALTGKRAVTPAPIPLPRIVAAWPGRHSAQSPSDHMPIYRDVPATGVNKAPSPGRQFPGDLKEITRDHADRVFGLWASRQLAARLRHARDEKP